MGCAEQDFDVSDALFYKVAPKGDGRVHGVEWGGQIVGGKRGLEGDVVGKSWTA